MRLAVRSGQPFGDVEDDVGPGVKEMLGKGLGGFEPDDGTDVSQRRFDRGNRAGIIPFGITIVGLSGGRFLVEREAYP